VSKGNDEFFLFIRTEPSIDHDKVNDRHGVKWQGAKKDRYAAQHCHHAQVHRVAGKPINAVGYKVISTCRWANSYLALLELPPRQHHYRESR